jgi:zinc transport system substrate-binding protein
MRAAVRAGAAISTAALVVAAGAVPASAAKDAGSRKSERLDVVAAFYPLAWVAEQVGGKRVVVTNLTPAGAEPHDLELTTKQRDQIEDAALVVVMGSGFQPTVEDAAEFRDAGTLELLARLPIEGAGSRVAEDEHADEDDPGGKDDHADEDEPGDEGLDPHVWLDPELMEAVVDETVIALSKVDPKGAATYEANAEALKGELADLDDRFSTGLAECDRDLIVTSHDAFGYLAAAYGLRQEGVAGLSPDEEPNPRRLAELADLAKDKGVTTIFTEELVSPRIAQTLAREAGGLKTATLNPLEGLTPKELERGDDYVSVMDRNLKSLRRALGCS